MVISSFNVVFFFRTFFFSPAAFSRFPHAYIAFLITPHLPPHHYRQYVRQCVNLLLVKAVSLQPQPEASIVATNNAPARRAKSEAGIPLRKRSMAMRHYIDLKSVHFLCSRPPSPRATSRFIRFHSINSRRMQSMNQSKFSNGETGGVSKRRMVDHTHRFV